MHSKVFVKLKKTLKPSRPGKKTQKKPKKPKKIQKTQKKPKKNTGLGFFKKTRVFSNPDFSPLIFRFWQAVLLLPQDHAAPGQFPETPGKPARVRSQTQRVHLPALHARICQRRGLCAPSHGAQTFPQQAAQEEKR